MRFSIVIPVFNEERSLEEFYLALKKALDGMGQSYQIIFVDDGSVDGSAQMLRRLSRCDSSLAVVELPRNLGQSTALQAGMDIAKGEYIITMDADLQNDPSDIPRMWDKLNEGFDLVCGWRRRRADPWAKIWEAAVACSLRRLVTGERTHDFGCALKIFRREVLGKVRLAGGMHRFLGLIALRQGYRVAEVQVNHLPRKHGRSNYRPLSRLPQCLRDFSLIYRIGPGGFSDGKAAKKV